MCMVESDRHAQLACRYDLSQLIRILGQICAANEGKEKGCVVVVLTQVSLGHFWWVLYQSVGTGIAELMVCQLYSYGIELATLIFDVEWGISPVMYVCKMGRQHAGCSSIHTYLTAVQLPRQVCP